MATGEDEMAACLLMTDTGHILINYNLSAVSINASQLSSILATLQQFSDGQTMSLLGLEGFDIVIVRSKDAPILVSLVCTSPKIVPRARLTAMVIHYECLRRFNSTLKTLVAQIKEEDEISAQAYTLTSALMGQNQNRTHEQFLVFQNSIIAPLFENTTLHPLARVDTGWQSISKLPNERIVIQGGFIVNCETHEHVFQSISSEAGGAIEPFILKSLQYFATCLVEAKALFRYNSITVQPVRRATRKMYIALHVLPQDCFCAAVIYCGHDTWFENQTTHLNQTIPFRQGGFLEYPENELLRFLQEGKTFFSTTNKQQWHVCCHLTNAVRPAMDRLILPFTPVDDSAFASLSFGNTNEESPRLPEVS